MALHLDDVANQMRERGIEPPAALYADGKKIVWAGNPAKPRKKNAWCVLREWTSPVSQKTYIVGAFGMGDESNWHKVEPTQADWSPADKADWLEARKAIERAQTEERTAQADAAATKAAYLWARANTEGASEYLQRKKVGAHGLRFLRGTVLVPLVDVAGKLHGLQFIAADGGKIFGTGTVKEGHFHLLGSVADGLPIAFAEGYATAASVHQATGWPVVACFDAGNLMPVVGAFRKLYPDHEFVIAADDDRWMPDRLCERLAAMGVPVVPKDFGQAAGGVRDMAWDLPDGRAVVLKAKWAKNRDDVYHIEGSTTEYARAADAAVKMGGLTKPLMLANAGRSKGLAAAKKHGGRMVCPSFELKTYRPTDFNDLHVHEGLERVREQLLAKPVPKPEKAPRANALASAETLYAQGDDTAVVGMGAALRFPYLDDKQNPRGIRENAYFALHEDPALRELVRFNEFSHALDKTRPAPWGGKAGKWGELDDLRLANYLAETHGLIVANPVTIQQAVLMAAYDCAHNPMLAYLEGLVWDQTPRRAFWLPEVFGAADTEYSKKVGCYFLDSMVARVYEPGCQMDYVLTLQGAQGARKSSVLRILAGEYFAGGTFRIGDKDSMQVLQGRLLFNFNEMDSMGKADQSAIKSFVTERTDVFRAPYAKGFSDYPRSCVLTADTNDDEFLKDPTGARRFWVVHCEDINVERMAQWRDQLFAEAVHSYKSGAQRYPDKEEEDRLFKPEQERWKFVDAWQDVLASYVNNTEIVNDYDGADGFTSNRQREFFGNVELLTRALKQDIAKIDRAGIQQRSVGNAMKALGFAKGRATKGSRTRGYTRVLADPTKPAQGATAPAQAGQSADGFADEVPPWQ